MHTAIHNMTTELFSDTTECRQIHVFHVVRRGRAEGGMENGIVNVTNRLRCEYRVSICALDSEETFSSRIQRPGTQFFVLPKRGAGIDWGLVVRLARVLRSSKADLVHSHNWGTFIYSVLAANLAGIAILHGEHGKNLGEVERDGATKRLAKRLLGRRIDRILTVCRAIADEWAAYGVPEDKIECIPNGVDIDRFRASQDVRLHRERFGLPASAFLIGSVGRLDQLKNHGVLIEALANLKDRFPTMHVALLGDGPLKQALQLQAHERSISDRVHFLGFRNDPDLFLAGLDLFVLPSKSEGMSNVVLEAMSTGVPVLCADLPSHHEIFVSGREGLLVDPCTAETLAEAVAELHNNPERRKVLGSAARARILSQFSLERMVADYERVYRAVCTRTFGVPRSQFDRCVKNQC